MFYIEPESGLCNRFRVIDSAIQLAKHRNTKVKVIWKVNHDVGAEFLDLFQPFETSTGIAKVVNDYTSDFHNIGYHQYFKGIKKLIKPALIDIPDWDNTDAWKKYTRIYDTLPLGRNEYDSVFEKELKKCWDEKWPGRSYYIRTYSRFFGNVRSDYSMFKPTSEIDLVSKKILDQFPEYVVGVHIRRSDNIDAINASPTDKYLLKMDKEMQANPKVKFFLATDSEVERENIVGIFKDRVLFQTSALVRNDLQGIKDALTELICLSKTNKIIGSSCSSFTETAISYNGMKDYKIIL